MINEIINFIRIAADIQYRCCFNRDIHVSLAKASDRMKKRGNARWPHRLRPRFETSTQSIPVRRGQSFVASSYVDSRTFQRSNRRYAAPRAFSLNKL